MARRDLSLPKVIVPTESVERQTRNFLRDHYSHVSKYKKNPELIEDKIEQVIDKAKNGWRNAPQSWDLRIKMLARSHHREDHRRSWGAAKAEKKAKELVLVETLEDFQEEEESMALPSAERQFSRDQMIRKLSPNDKKFFRQREAFYKREFDFNDSSDYALLMEVVMSEIKIQKLHRMEMDIMRHPKDVDTVALANISKILSESHAMLERSLKGLGVTRDQRKDELDAADGDLAVLGMSLDKKLAAKEAQAKLHAQEEDEGLDRKYLRGDVYMEKGIQRPLHNRIPEDSEIDDIIKDAGIKSIGVKVEEEEVKQTKEEKEAEKKKIEMQPEFKGIGIKGVSDGEKE